ncbi:MAG: TIM44-like domain-containing protein [Rhizobiales bacterium]|nr:TIM44-like domain-containing protein [Hyphomicrobiales bacterium]
MTQPTQAARPGATATNTGAAARPGLFSRPGLMGGLLAGFLGAGLLGMLFGQGLFGNLAGLASIIGLVVQLALVAGVAWFAWNWWQRRSQPQAAFAGAGGGPLGRDAMSASPMSASPMKSGLGGSVGSGLGGGLGGGATQSPMTSAGNGVGYGGPPAAAPSDEIGVKPADYDAFERLLGEVQAAYAAGDVNALGQRATPEMVGFMTEELDEHAKRGVVSSLSGVKLLQGDLAEAWREGSEEYATVALRYEIIDQMLDRRTRAVVEGAPTPIEVTELWTFVRSRGGNWQLAGIQQTDEEPA